MIDMANLSIPTSLNNYKGIVDEIKETDVLCGSKNTSLNKHHGNALLRQQVNKHLDEYDQADTKQEKMRINRVIIATMRKKFHSRFLRQKGNGAWAEIDEQSVRDKVSHALRFASIQRKKDEEYQKNRVPLPAFSPATSSSSVAAAAAAATMTDTNDDLSDDPAFTKMLEAVHQSQQRILQAMLGRKVDASNSSCMDSDNEDDEKKVSSR